MSETLLHIPTLALMQSALHNNFPLSASTIKWSELSSLHNPSDNGFTDLCSQSQQVAIGASWGDGKQDDLVALNPIPTPTFIYYFRLNYASNQGRVDWVRSILLCWVNGGRPEWRGTMTGRECSMTAVTNLALDRSKAAMKRSLFSRSLSVCSSLDSFQVAALDAHPVLHSH
jgi:hypothetical protein